MKTKAKRTKTMRRFALTAALLLILALLLAFDAINGDPLSQQWAIPVSYTHLRAHETKANLVCRLLLEKKKRTVSGKT